MRKSSHEGPSRADRRSIAENTGARRSPERTGLFPVFPALQGIYREKTNFEAVPTALEASETAELRHFSRQIPCARNREFQTRDQGTVCGLTANYAAWNSEEAFVRSGGDRS
jgi:hypothetical protein